MAGSSFQPPIHLDPTQDASQQTAFINQNFQNLASTLETNSFRIVETGQSTITPIANTNSVVTIPHGLGFPPIPFVFLNNVKRSFGTNVITTNANIPFPTWSSISLDNTNNVVKFGSWFDCVADDNNLYVFSFNAQNTSPGTFTFSYYLVQQSAD